MTQLRRESSLWRISYGCSGEDVVAGVRTPQPVKIKRVLPALRNSCWFRKLEKHFKDMQDFEFTIEDEKLYMLQTRNGKRTGLAVVLIATEMVKEKLIDWKTAIKRVPAEQLDRALAPVFDAAAQKAAKKLCKGLLPALVLRLVKFV